MTECWTRMWYIYQVLISVTQSTWRVCIYYLSVKMYQYCLLLHRSPLLCVRYFNCSRLTFVRNGSIPIALCSANPWKEYWIKLSPLATSNMWDKSSMLNHSINHIIFFPLSSRSISPHTPPPVMHHGLMLVNYGPVCFVIISRGVGIYFCTRFTYCVSI